MSNVNIGSNYEEYESNECECESDCEYECAVYENREWSEMH